MNSISKKYYMWKLNRMQKSVDKKYAKEGLTDDVLEKQIKINTKRNKLNITDPNEPTNKKGFVQ